MTVMTCLTIVHLGKIHLQNTLSKYSEIKVSCKLYNIYFFVIPLSMEPSIHNKSQSQPCVKQSSSIIIIIIIIISFKVLGHFLTRSGLTYPEVSSKIYQDSFCQLGSSVSLPCVIYFEAFYLHVVTSFSCIPVICPKLVLFLAPLQFVHLFCNLSKCILLFFPKHARPEAKGSNPTNGLTLLWARNPFRENFNHWKDSRKEAAGQIFFKRQDGCGKRALLLLTKHNYSQIAYSRTPNFYSASCHLKSAINCLRNRYS